MLHQIWSSWLTESPLAQKCICIFQCCSLPPPLLKVVRKELLGRRLLSIPCRHSPQTKEDVFLFQSHIVKTAIDRVFFVRLCILIASNHLKLSSLLLLSVYFRLKSEELTRADKSVIHINIPLSLACSHSILPWNCPETKSINMS